MICCMVVVSCCFSAFKGVELFLDVFSEGKACYKVKEFIGIFSYPVGNIFP